MRLTILVDVIAIAARIAVILPPLDDRAENAAEDRSCNRAADGAHTGQDGTGDRAADRADNADLRAEIDRIQGLGYLAG